MFERICLILLFNLLFFFKTLGYKYCSDCVSVYRSPPNFRNKWEKRLFQLNGMMRVNPQEDHFITIILHALTCVFIYLGFGANDISYLAALLFSFNPINNQASVWISGRSYAFAAFGMTGALAFPLVGPLFFVVSAYYNAGFLAPLAFIGSPYPWLTLIIPAVWAHHWPQFRVNVGEKIKQEMFVEDKKIHPEKLILFIKTMAFYFVHSILPFKTTFYHSYMQSMAGSGKEKAVSFKDRFFWIGLVMLAGIIYYWTSRPWDMVSFGLLWWVVTIAPFCNIFRVSQEIAERYAYLPNAGLMFVLATVLAPYPVWAAAFIAMYATKLWFYMDSFQDDYYLVENACMNSPNSWFAWHVRAMKRWDSRSYQEAVILWVMAKMISPKEFKVLFNIATALKVSKNDKEAQEFIEEAMKNVPKGQEEQTKLLYDNWMKGEMAIVL